MKITETGVLPSSDVYFHTASETAVRIYFYLRCTGRYQCDGTYRVERKSYNSYLILHVLHGSGYAYLDGRRHELSQGHFVMIDCYQPHCYGTDTQWTIECIHFVGAMAKEYFQLIKQNKNQLILPPDPYAASRSLDRIFAMYHRSKGVSEPLISKHITDLLTEFILYTGNDKKQATQSGYIEEVITHIAENIDQPLKIEELAKKASLSPFYFIRVFKKETGYTPHEYLLIARVNTAKFFLKTTGLAIKEIAFRSGFSNECTFCTAFKRLTGQTPLEYRGREPMSS
jgi:AraC-like DNA-binding protein